VNEEEYMNERASLSFVKGHLADVCRLDGTVDVDVLAENVYAFRSHFSSITGLQKAVLGEIVGCQRDGVSHAQLVAVSQKIAVQIFHR